MFRRSLNSDDYEVRSGVFGASGKVFLIFAALGADLNSYGFRYVFLVRVFDLGFSSSSTALWAFTGGL